MAPAPAELLGGYAPPTDTLHLVGRAGFFASLVVVGVLERVQFRLRFLETRTWWASNGRDVLNLTAFLLLSAALGLMGFGGPVGFALAASLVVLLIALESVWSRHRHGTTFSVCLALALGAPILVAPGVVDRLTRAALVFLFR